MGNGVVPFGTVAVLGATGQQGGAVAAALLERGQPVRAVVRDPSAPRARALRAAGAEVVPGDQRDLESLRAAFAGARGVFSVQPSSGQAGTPVTDEEEVVLGINVADAAQQAAVAHLVYSSANAAGPGNTGVGHFDSKARIEAHIHDLRADWTIVRPVAFMEILLLPGMGLHRGRMSFLMRPDQVMQFVAVRDVGRIAASILADPGRHRGRTLELAGDEFTGITLAAALSVATGRTTVYERFSDEVLADPMLARLAALVDEGTLAGHASLSQLRDEFPFLLDVGNWLLGPGASLLELARRGTSGGVELR